MRKGFYFTQGRTAIFLVSDAQRKTDSIAKALIDTIATVRNIAPEIIERAKADAPTLADFKRRTDAATLEEKNTPNGIKYYTISGKCFCCNFPEEDFLQDVIVAQQA